MYNKRPRLPNINTFLILLILSVLIFYQIIITLILPFRWNIFVLLVEIKAVQFYKYNQVIYLLQ
jgi:hypothetical protein